jgi:hypothetical protein
LDKNPFISAGIRLQGRFLAAATQGEATTVTVMINIHSAMTVGRAIISLPGLTASA